jgi:thiol:disulfide interchange protein DsbC
MLRTLVVLSMLLSTAAAANEAAVKKAMQKKYPDIPVENVAKTPLPGIYEIYAGGQILYADENVNYLIVSGRMIDVDRRSNLTEERMRLLTAVRFDDLPLDFAFRMVRGNGKRRIAYFTDPNCGYCRRLDQELAKMNNITVHVFLYPILSQDSRDKAAAVWCSRDRAAAYNDLMLHGKPPRAAGKCDTPIDKIVAYGQQKGINGTPTLFLSDGQRVTGAVPADRLEKMIDGAR